MNLQCKRGHEMTGDNLYIRPSDGWRGCRACRHINYQKYKKRNRYNERTPSSKRVYRDATDATVSRPETKIMEEAQRRSNAPYRSITSALMGDPPIGYSQLDRRQGSC